MEKFLTLEDGNIEEVIKKNLIIASKMRNEIKKLSEISLNDEEETEILKDIPALEKEIFIDDEEEYSYYYEDIKEYLNKSDEIIEEDIYDMLPSLDNKNYMNIIMRIKKELKEELKAYELFKKIEDSSFIEVVLLEQDKIKKIISYINSHRTREISINKTHEKIKNNVIFMKTSYGSICALNDLSSIDPEYYDSFKELIESIENGTFKNVKRFSNADNILKGISEVKNFKTRVVFDRINKNTYIIIYAFVKKSNNDMGYVKQLHNRVDFYKANEKYIKESVNLEYINEHNKIFEDLKTSLEDKTKVKGVR